MQLFSGKIITSRDSATNTMPTLTKSPVSEVIMADSKPIKATPVCTVSGCDSTYRIVKGLCNIHYKRHRKYGDTKSRCGLSAEERFWALVVKTDNCWEWKSQPKNAYGRLNVDGKLILAHRYSFFLHNGHWPEPSCLHSCDNKRCVNPAHLSAGTQQQNVKERFERMPGNVAVGERQGCAKLTAEEVLEIRATWKPKKRGRGSGDGCSIAELARRFGVSRFTLATIVKRRGWKHL